MSSVEGVLIVAWVILFVYLALVHASLIRHREETSKGLHDRVHEFRFDTLQRDVREARWDFDALLDHLRVEKRSKPPERIFIPKSPA
jgi:hypothetical protein